MKSIKRIHSRHLMGAAASLALLFATIQEGQAISDTQYIIENGTDDFSIEASNPRLEFEVDNGGGNLFMHANQPTGQMGFGDSTTAPMRAYHFRPTRGANDLNEADASILVDNTVRANGLANSVAPRNMFELLNNGAPRFVLRDNSFSPDRLYTFALNPQGNFTMTRAGVPGVEFILYNNNGNIEMGPGTSTTFRVTAGGVQATNYGMLSDREAKKDIEELTSEEVLSKIKEVPVSTWRFKGEEESSLHIGPMAQDFRAAFGTGTSDRVINMGDLAGVALAGVRSLSQELETRDAEVKELRKRLDEERARSSELEERIDRLEKLLKNQM